MHTVHLASPRRSRGRRGPVGPCQPRVAVWSRLLVVADRTVTEPWPHLVGGAPGLAAALDPECRGTLDRAVGNPALGTSAAPSGVGSAWPGARR